MLVLRWRRMNVEAEWRRKKEGQPNKKNEEPMHTVA